MATAYQSVEHAVFESDGTPDDLTITKPSGLADGDLMVAFLGGVDNGATWTATGWAVADTLASGDIAVRTLIKVANSTDAAASDFTFTLTGAVSGDGLGGMIVRLSGSAFTDINNIVVSSDNNASATSHTFDNDIESYVSSVLLLAVFSRDDAGGHSGQAIATSNPSWTEVKDVQFSATREVGFSLAHASYTPGGNTGDASITFANTEEAIGVLVSVKENTNVTGTHAQLTSTPTFFAPTGSAGVLGTHALLESSPTFFAPTARVDNPVWSDQEKGTAVWTNQEK